VNNIALAEVPAGYDCFLVTYSIEFDRRHIPTSRTSLCTRGRPITVVTKMCLCCSDKACAAACTFSEAAAAAAAVAVVTSEQWQATLIHAHSYELVLCRIFPALDIHTSVSLYSASPPETFWPIYYVCHVTGNPWRHIVGAGSVLQCDN